MAVGIALLSACGSAPRHHQAAARPSPKPSPRAIAARAVCPLTGAVPSGGVPARPALAVKVGNEPAALPQSGLDHADIIFEEPIEGAITRLLAIYQCQAPAAVGPVRSTRWIDDQLLPRFSHPAFTYAGGIIPDENLVASSGVVNLNAFGAGESASYRTSNRYPPENLYVSPTKLWALDSSHALPPPVFSYSASAPAGTATHSITLGWSSYYSASWTWDAARGQWARTEYGSAEHDASGAAVTATNVVVLRVATYLGPYAEDASGEHGVHSVVVGSGSALLLRGGQTYSGTWSAPTIDSPFSLTSATGSALHLAPGNTWVELVPTTGSVTTTP